MQKGYEGGCRVHLSDHLGTRRPFSQIVSDLCVYRMEASLVPFVLGCEPFSVLVLLVFEAFFPVVDPLRA